MLADGGICCIDEFNLMRQTDRACIHEAMEQQTISMAKAGMVCKLSTRCAILAAANPKNLFTMSEPGGTSSLNIGIDSPLLSRFDLVYILRDDRNPDWDSRIGDHLLDLSSSQRRPKQRAEELWPMEKLQAHFVAIRNIHPQMSDEASTMLGAYYRRCRSDRERDLGRTTVRLLDSLTRLAQAHARLLFRDQVNASDAAMVIRLMESTYGFGRLLQPFDVITEKLPLGPNPPDISEVYRVLNLGEYRGSQETETKPLIPGVAVSKIDTEKTEPSVAIVQRETLPLDEPGRVQLDDILNFDFEKEAETVIDGETVPSQISNAETQSNLFADEDMDVDDAVLSQALDQVEQIVSHSQSSQPNPASVQQESIRNLPNSPTPSVPKRKTLTLHHSQQPGTSKRDAPNVLSPIELNVAPRLPNRPALARNRLLMTQSDDSDDDEPGPCIAVKRKTPNQSENDVSPKRKVSTQTLQKLNVFQNPAANAKVELSTDAMKPDDSAYETMSASDIQMSAENSQTMDANGIVPAISNGNCDSDEDYSCLDFDF